MKHAILTFVLTAGTFVSSGINRMEGVSVEDAPYVAREGVAVWDRAAYYDEKPPFEWSRKFRDAARRTDGTLGYMYTTWRHAYGDLPAWMKMMGEPCCREGVLK